MKRSGNRNGSPRGALNGFSVEKIVIDQEGDLTVTFDLPVKQRSKKYDVSLSGSRTLDVYECPELAALIKRLFAAIKDRVRRGAGGRTPACGSCADARCCRAYNVLVSAADIDRLRGRMTRRAFVRAYTDPAVDWSGDYRYQLRAVADGGGEERCVFLAPDRRGRMRCSVYRRRPWICRNFDVAACPDFEPSRTRPRRRRGGSR